MPGNRKSVYWDANVFLSYVNATPDQMPILEALLDQAAKREITIYTSALSRVEVAFSDSEQQSRVLSPEIENQINSLWANRRVVRSIEIVQAITLAARGLMRDAIARGWSLKPPDAIHLATAQWLPSAGFGVDEFHTYDASLFRYADVMRFDIHEPRTEQPRLALT